MARILLAEDDDSLRAFLVSSLSRAGHDVTGFGDGDAAWEALEHGSFDLLLTDIVMPGPMKGPEIAAEARRLSPAIKVIYTTGYAQQAALANADLPADAPVLSKPYRRATLARLLRSVLEPSRRMQTA